MSLDLFQVKLLIQSTVTANANLFAVQNYTYISQHYKIATYFYDYNY
jgi:hypothetical protein